jgi:hypothetical protein
MSPSKYTILRGIQSSIDPSPGLLHPFPNQDGSLVKGWSAH